MMQKLFVGTVLAVAANSVFSSAEIYECKAALNGAHHYFRVNKENGKIKQFFYKSMALDEQGATCDISFNKKSTEAGVIWFEEKNKLIIDIADENSVKILQVSIIESPKKISLEINGLNKRAGHDFACGLNGYIASKINFLKEPRGASCQIPN